ncbi:MAG: class I SAM-dependent methyltransferase [Hyphomicrobiaceae bacterium]
MRTEDVGKYWEANAATWTRLSRSGRDVYRDTLNTPAFLNMLPPISEMEGLDVGCGEGTNTRELAKRGARMTGIDIAPTFVNFAREAEKRAPLGIDFVVGDGTKLDFSDGSFDFVTAFMSLMDMASQDRALSEIGRVLRPSGFVQFSILHPCFVPPTRRTIRDGSGRTTAVEIANYFDGVPGEVETWWFSTLTETERKGVEPFRVPRFHRTLSDWVNGICSAGLTIEEFGEPRPSEEVAKAFPKVADTRVAPIFLHVRARKFKSVDT